LTALLKEQPDNALVHRQMALYYDSQGRTADVEKSLTRAFELQPNSEELLRDLVQFYIREKQTDRAIQRINAVPDDKKQPFQYELLGFAYLQSGKLEDSEKALKKALEKDPSRSISDAILTLKYIWSGHLDEAQKELDQLIKKN